MDTPHSLRLLAAKKSWQSQPDEFNKLKGVLNMTFNKIKSGIHVCPDFTTAVTSRHIDYDDFPSALVFATRSCNKEMVFKILESKIISQKDVTEIYWNPWILTSKEIIDLMLPYTKH